MSLEQAREELQSLSQSMKERWPAARLSAVDAVPLQEDLVSTARRPLHLLLGAVALVLLVAFPTIRYDAAGAPRFKRTCRQAAVNPRGHGAPAASPFFQLLAAITAGIRTFAVVHSLGPQ